MSEQTKGTLNSFSALDITGPDSTRFLHGQCSINVEKLTADRQRLACFCTPQGRVIAMVQIEKIADGFRLYLPTSNVENLHTHLQKYKVFFRQCEMKPISAKIHVEIDGESNLPRLDLTDSPSTSPMDVDYLAYLAQHKIPWIDARASGLFLPHNLGLPELGGVDFDKGCFTGQEIIARMQYRGKLKSHLQLFRCKGKISTASDLQDMETDAVVPGTPVDADGARAGSLVCAIYCPQSDLSYLLLDLKDSALQAEKISLDIENLPILELVSHEEQKDKHS